MSVQIKVGGSWVQANQVWVKRNGSWVQAVDVYVKRSGVWTLAHEWDTTPPNSPILSLGVVDTTFRDNGVTKAGRHIQVGVRTSGALHDPDLKRIRVLTTYAGAMPTTYNGGTYTGAAGQEYPNEPWSDFQFNGFSGSSTTKDSSVFRYKSWPRNATNETQMASGRYYFAVWAEDLNGNWSVGVFNQIWVPKLGTTSANIVVKEARFQANNSGSFASGGMTTGVLRQAGNPTSRGLWFYGNKISEAIPANATIRSAQILVPRDDDDGSAVSNVYIFRHGYTTLGSVGTSLTTSEVKTLGTINKASSKWFAIPESYYPDLMTSTQKGFGLNYKDPAKATAGPDDFTVVKSASDDLRSGELHVVWEEPV